MASLAAAQAAKDNLRQKLQGQPWLRGIGLTQSKCMGPDPYEVQVNVDSTETLRALLACDQTPRSWMGVPVQYSVVGDIKAFGDVTITTQDYVNVFIGFAVLFGTFMVGKIAVESIIESRKENFDPKGQPPEAVKAKETTVDGIIKFAVMGYSIWSLQEEVPALLAELKGLTK